MSCESVIFPPSFFIVCFNAVECSTAQTNSFAIKCDSLWSIMDKLHRPSAKIMVRNLRSVVGCLWTWLNCAKLFQKLQISSIHVEICDFRCLADLQVVLNADFMRTMALVRKGPKLCLFTNNNRINISKICLTIISNAFLYVARSAFKWFVKYCKFLSSD